MVPSRGHLSLLLIAPLRLDRPVQDGDSRYHPNGGNVTRGRGQGAPVPTCFTQQCGPRISGDCSLHDLPINLCCCGRAGRVIFFETPHGRKLILISITPGHIFGAAALVSRHSTYLVSTETVQDSVVLVWDGATIRALARRFPQLLENAALIPRDYMSWYVAVHAALTFPDCSRAARPCPCGFGTQYRPKSRRGH